MFCIYTFEYCTGVIQRIYVEICNIVWFAARQQCNSEFHGEGHSTSYSYSFFCQILNWRGHATLGTTL